MDNAFIATSATEEELETARDTFGSLAAKANEALDEDDRCLAAKLFREILGRNTDDENVFPMPEDCNDDGSKRAVAVMAGDRHVPAGDRRFA